MNSVTLPTTKPGIVLNEHFYKKTNEHSEPLQGSRRRQVGYIKYCIAGNTTRKIVELQVRLGIALQVIQHIGYFIAGNTTDGYFIAGNTTDFEYWIAGKTGYYIAGNTTHRVFIAGNTTYRVFHCR